MADNTEDTKTRNDKIFNSFQNYWPALSIVLFLVLFFTGLSIKSKADKFEAWRERKWLEKKQRQSEKERENLLNKNGAVVELANSDGGLPAPVTSLRRA